MTGHGGGSKVIFLRIMRILRYGPGGPGTLDETIEIITWRQLRLHAKPIVIVDDGGYWQPLLDLMEHTIENGFAHDVFRTFYTVVSSPEEVLPAIEELPESFLEERPERL